MSELWFHGTETVGRQYLPEMWGQNAAYGGKELLDLKLSSARFLFTALPRFQLLEEVMTLIVDKDECREVLHSDLPDCFHAEFRVCYALNALDTILGKHCCYTADSAEIEATMLLACIGYDLSTVALGYHYKRTSVILELVYVRIHAVGCGRSH